MEADERMEPTIIIVNWNSKDYLQKCIASIPDSKSNIQYEIVVIDGGSFDGTSEMLKQCYPQGNFIQSDKNLSPCMLGCSWRTDNKPRLGHRG